MLSAFWTIGGSSALAHRQHAGQQQGRIDRGELALPLACAGVEVDEVVEPAVLLFHSPGEAPQRRSRAIDDLGAWQPAAVGGDAHSGKSETYRGNAADVASALVGRRPIGPCTVADDAGLRVRLLPEEHERAVREIFEERIVCWRQT